MDKLSAFSDNRAVTKPALDSPLLSLAISGDRPATPAPMVSVIIPVHNRAEPVEEAIQSVLGQEFEDWELLLIDDHSDDHSLAVIEAWAARDPRIQALKNPRRGVSAARNVGLKASRGQLIAYLDSDDRWHPRHLRVLVDAIGHRTFACAYTAMELWHQLPSGETRRQIVYTPYSAAQMRRANFITLLTFAHTRALYEAAGGFNERMTRLVDWDLIARMARLSPPIALNEVTCDYRNKLDPHRVSVARPYGANRALFALVNRWAQPAQLPTIDCIGPQAAALVRPLAQRHLVRLRELSPADLPAVSGLRFSEVVLWSSSEWEEAPEHQAAFDSLCAQIDEDAALAIYLIPEGASPARLPYLAQRDVFDVFGAGSEAHVSWLRALQPDTIALNPIDRIIPAAPTPGELISVQELLAIIAGQAPLGGEPSEPAEAPISAGALVATVHIDGPGGPQPLSLSPEDDTPLPDLQGCMLHVHPEGRPQDELRFGYVDDPAEAAFKLLLGCDVLLTPPSNPAAAPWGLRTTPLLGEAEHQRVALRRAAAWWLRAGPAARRPRVLWVHGKHTAGCTRKRAFEIAQAVDGVFETHLIPREDFKAADCLGADLVVFQRWVRTDPAEALAAMQRCQGTRKVFAYEIDDHVFEDDDAAGRLLARVDCVFTSTRPLAEALRERNPRVFILPNAIDAERLLPVPPAALDPAFFHVVLASTSAHGLDQVQQIAPLRVGDKPVLFHVFAHFIDLPEATEGVQLHAAVDPETLMAYLKAADLIINSADRNALLRQISKAADDRYDRYVEGKSELKFQLAGLAQTPLISARQPSIYAELITPGVNGWLADSVEELREALVLALSDPELRAQVAARAYDDVLAEHTLARRWPRWAAALNAALALGEDKPRWTLDDPRWRPWPAASPHHRQPPLTQLKVWLREATPPTLWAKLRRLRRRLRPLEDRLRGR